MPSLRLHLLDGHVGDDPGNVDLGGHRLERQLVHGWIVGIDEEERS